MKEEMKSFSDHMAAVQEVCRQASLDGIDLVVIARETNPFSNGVKYALRRTCDMALSIGMLTIALNFVQDELVDGEVDSE